MPKRISDADSAGASAQGKVEVKVALITLDGHVAGPIDRAREALRRDIPGLRLTMHASSEWGSDPATLERAKAAVADADIVIATMLFLEDQLRAILPALEARRDHCDAMICVMSAPEAIKLTRIGKFEMGKPESGAIKILKRLRGSRKPGQSAGKNQMAMLRRIPRILKYIPGTAQDMRVFFLTMQYWLSCSDVNMANMVRMLIDRYSTGPRAAMRGALTVGEPVVYPDTGLYHPAMKDRVTERASDLPAGDGPRVGLLVMRSYILAGDTLHYDGVISALEARGLTVVPAFAAGLDARPAVETYFMENGRATVDAVVSLTGFSLVGGPAFNDSNAAVEMLRQMDVPYISGQALEFQSIEEWRASSRGMMPVESTIMLAIPELDGTTAPTVFGGRCSSGDGHCHGCARACEIDPTRAHHMHPCLDQVDRLASRIANWVSLRRSERAARKVAVVLFNFPPNAGATGTAAFLGVFESLFNTLKAMKAEGYTVELPADVDALREAILEGNAGQFGTDANIHARISADDHVRREPHLAEIESQWGPAPGRVLTDGRDLFVLGKEFGNVLVAVQPGFGYEGDPMRMLFEQGFAPTHAFSAFYRYLREDYAADAVLHFGTHGALEFMPGKQTGLDGASWPERLIGGLPNVYLYAANNPSEGTIAKRRGGATLISYMTPPLKQAGLYKGLIDLKASLDRWRGLTPDRESDRDSLAALIQTQAVAVDLTGTGDDWTAADAAKVDALIAEVAELEQSLIPYGLHVVGEAPSDADRADFLRAMNDASDDAIRLPDDAVAALAAGAPADRIIKQAGLKSNAEGRAAVVRLAEAASHLATPNAELKGMMHALDGGYIEPVAGGDILRSPEILPTGRNMHGFDPFRIPSAFAVKDGWAQADRLIARHVADGNAPPRAVAMVLWGTDNLKTEGGPIGQALALMGAKPRYDSFGRLAGADLIPLEELDRPRIDVTMTLSGIFRDLMPLQTRMLAEAAFKAASVEEPAEMNPIRANALAYQARHDCDLEVAALRVFGNDDGAYGGNVNLMVDGGAWDNEEELGETFAKRKGFAYGMDGKPVRHEGLLRDVLSNVDMAYQNLESVEVGVTTIDHYFDSLGGVARAVGTARGETVPVYIGDQTTGDGSIRTLGEQIALETRTRTLNPAWYESMLAHGYEGVRQIEANLTNTVGWSATTGEVNPWVYKQITETFVLDPEMRNRMAKLNPKASARVANRLLEAHERNYWTPDDEMLEALRAAGDELEDRLEGINVEAVA
jgi:magnesium chelatase subunit H